MSLRCSPLSLFTAALCFSCGLAGTWRPAVTPLPLERDEKKADPNALTATASKKDPDPRPGSIYAAAMTPWLTLEEATTGTPRDRFVKMGRFITNASVADLKKFVEGAGKSVSQSERLLAWTRWAELDPEGAVASDKSGIGWWCLAKANSNLALERALKADPFALERVLFSIAQDDPQRAKALFEKYPDHNNKRNQQALVEGLSRKGDMEAAARFALDHNISCSSPLEVWLRLNPDGAIRWGMALEDPRGRNRFMSDLTAKLTRMDPARAMELAVQMNAGASRTRRTADALSALSRQNPEAAAAALNKMPEGYEREVARAAFAGGAAGGDADAAIEAMKAVDWKQISGKIDSAPRKDDLVWGSVHSSLVELMATIPAATADQLASDAGQGRALNFAIQEWAALEPEKASAWLNTQPKGAIKDQGILALNRWLTLNAPEPDFTAAIAWSQAATPATQSLLYEKIFPRWNRHSPEAAREALESLSIPDEERARLGAFLD